MSALRSGPQVNWMTADIARQPMYRPTQAGGDRVDSQVFNILVVDDDEMVTKALSTLLKRPDRRVLTCTDPSEVPAIMARQSVELVISDEEMPKMTGVRLLTQLKQSHPEA